MLVRSCACGWLTACMSMPPPVPRARVWRASGRASDRPQGAQLLSLVAGPSRTASGPLQGDMPTPPPVPRQTAALTRVKSWQGQDVGRASLPLHAVHTKNTESTATARCASLCVASTPKAGMFTFSRCVRRGTRTTGQMWRPWCVTTRILEHRETTALNVHTEGTAMPCALRMATTCLCCPLVHRTRRRGR
jgi:hypothetical protein